MGPSDRTATMAGRVIVSGPLRDARVSIDQLHVDDNIGGVREHVGDTATDADGRYHLGELGTLNGLFLVTASGGNFTDLVSGETVALDPSEQVRTLVEVELFETRTGALVSPIGHLVESLARARLADGVHANLYEARGVAAEHVHAHYGGLDWQRIDPAALNQPAPSATDPVRAALIADALSILTDEIATAAGASHQEVNAYSLMVAWAADLEAGTFDGNDGNDRAHGSGLQLGECAAVPVDCVIRPPPPACSLGACRAACDLYAGSPRGALSGALLKLVRSPFNQTGITDEAILPLARAMADNADPVLFGDACRDSLDRTAPTLIFETPTPADGVHVRGSISVRIRAVDDIDPAPDLAWLGGLNDSDGDPTNAVATAEISTTSVADGPLLVGAESVDTAGNATEAGRMFVVDNTAPVLTIDPAGFFVAGADWWTMTDGAMIAGTISESNLDRVSVYVGASAIGDAAIAGNSWMIQLPPGIIPATIGEDVRVVAADRAGNSVQIVQRVKLDTSPPAVEMISTTVRDEGPDRLTFSESVDSFGFRMYDPTHSHIGTAVTLGPPTACDMSAPTVRKYAYLTDEASPPYVMETGGGGAGGRNPIHWRTAVTDSGVGLDLSASEYQVRDVTSNSIVLSWRSLSSGTIIPGGRDYTIPIYRNGTSWPSIPAVGTDEHTFEITIRARDLLGRSSTVARCWNQRLLASPVYIGPVSGAATTGNYGRYGFAQLSLADTVAPIDPVSTLLLNEPGPGVGLMQFPVFNITTEPVWMAFDFRVPTAVTYQRDDIRDRWGETSRTTVNVDCGRVVVDAGPPVVTEPNYALPGCNVAATPGGGAGVSGSASGTVSANYTIRVFEEVGPAGELVPCLSCAPVTMPINGIERVMVQLPPRGPPLPVAQPPRKFWVQPGIRSISEFWPPNASPPFTEISFVGGAVVTGHALETRTGCSNFVAPATSTGTWRCTRQSVVTRYRALTRGQLDIGVDLEVMPFVSRSGASLETPAYFQVETWTELRDLFDPAPEWNSSEILPPAF